MTHTIIADDLLAHLRGNRWLVDLHGEKCYNYSIRKAPALLQTAGGVSQMRRHHD